MQPAPRFYSMAGYQGLRSDKQRRRGRAGVLLEPSGSFIHAGLVTSHPRPEWRSKRQKKVSKHKNLSDFGERGRIVMARRLDQSISTTAALVGCSRSAVVSIYQKWSKEGTVANRRQDHERPRLTDARGERRLARVTLIQQTSYWCSNC
ncbi:hypothetical protein QTP86_014984 [Hemibagrus guttatus]|nr:hypothetical protein QTP86_014984 [Hemibagrus guttatus]